MQRKIITRIRDHMAYFDKYGVKFSNNRKTLVRCPADYKGEYIIPDGVTRIEEEAFYECYTLTSVVILIILIIIH